MRILYINPRFPELLLEVSKKRGVTCSIFNSPMKRWPQAPLETMKTYFDIFRSLKKCNFHDWDIIHVQDRYNLLPFMVESKLLHRKLVYTCHEGLWLSNTNILSVVRRSPTRSLEGLSMLICDAIIALSRDLANRLSYLLPNIARKVYVIPNGVDASFFRPLTNPRIKSIRENFGDPECLILCVSRFGPEKGIDVLVRAIHKLVVDYHFQDIKCVMKLHGNSAYRDFIYNMINHLNLGNYIQIIEGFWSQARLLSFYNMADVFCLPSRYDAYPMTLLEAMACGKPLVGPNYGGPRDIIRNGVNGYLFKVNDYEDLAQVLASLIRDKKKRIHMGQLSRRIAERYFSWSLIADKTLRVYEDLMQK